MLMILNYAKFGSFMVCIWYDTDLSYTWCTHTTLFLYYMQIISMIVHCMVHVYRWCVIIL